MLRLIQPKGKRHVTTAVEKGPEAANGNGDGDHREKTHCETTDKMYNVPSHDIKPGPENAPPAPAAEKMCLLVGPGFGKPNHDSITHATGMYEFICPGSILSFQYVLMLDSRYSASLKKGFAAMQFPPARHEKQHCFSSFRWLCSESSWWSSLPPRHYSQQETSGASQQQNCNINTIRERQYSKQKTSVLFLFLFAFS